MSNETYSRRLRRATWLAFGVPIAVGAALSFVLRASAPGQDFWLVFPALLAGCAVAFWACVPWWRRLDDMQRHGHMVSWYWGGMGGGIAMCMGLLAAHGAGSEMAEGALLMMLAQGAGFFAFWAAWMWQRRGDSA